MHIEGIPAAQVVLHVEQHGGGFQCTAYGNVPTGRCAYIVVAGAPREAALLGKAIGDAILAISASVAPVATPCNQSYNAGPLGCAAIGDPKCQKLLVLAGNGTDPVPEPSFASMWKDRGDFSVLPVLPESARTSFARLIPKAYHEKNAAYWKTDIGEVVPHVFSAAAMTVDVPRVFITYRQKESQKLAVQLFDALSHAGFDVFLDHYRVPAATNFQERLTQELGDKSMVVVLESAGIRDSEWTIYEINTARACELTLVAVHLPGGTKVPGIEDAARKSLADADFEGSAFDAAATVRDAVLHDLVTWIAQEHDAGLLRRRGALRSAIENALKVRKVPQPTVDGAGIMHVVNQGKEYKIWASVRSPELDDFHIAHMAMTSSPQCGVVVGLARLFAVATRRRYDWLSDVCRVALVDKGEIGAAADRIARGDPLP